METNEKPIRFNPFFTMASRDRPALAGGPFSRLHGLAGFWTWGILGI